jgi:WD40 repeat protein
VKLSSISDQWIAFAPHDEYAAFSVTTDRDGGVAIVSLPTFKTRLLKAGVPTQVYAVSPDGLSLAAGGLYGEVILWQLDHPEPVVLGRHSRYVTAVSFSPNGLWLCSASRDRTVRLFSIRGGASAQVNFLNPVWDATFSPDGKYVLVATGVNVHVLYAAVLSGPEILDATDSVTNGVLDTSTRKVIYQQDLHSIKGATAP